VFLAGVVKLADAPDSKSGGLNARVGSIPSSGTIPPAAVIHGDAMPLLRSALFGLATAILAVVVWIIAKFVIPIWVPYLLSRFGNDGLGGATATISSGSILIAAVLGFALGFFWRFRRLSRLA